MEHQFGQVRRNTGLPHIPHDCSSGNEFSFVLDVTLRVHRKHYPVYVKDSLYNTNPTFDYGAFRELEQNLRDPLTDISTFAFTFNDEGVYVFADAANLARLQIVRRS